MKKQFYPVKNNAEVEKIIHGTYQGVLCMADNNTPYAIPVNHNYPATDQRGVTRPIDGNSDHIARCDVGAYEVPTRYATYLPAITR